MAAAHRQAADRAGARAERAERRAAALAAQADGQQAELVALRTLREGE